MVVINTFGRPQYWPLQMELSTQQITNILQVSEVSEEEEIDPNEVPLKDKIKHQLKALAYLQILFDKWKSASKEKVPKRKQLQQLKNNCRKFSRSITHARVMMKISAQEQLTQTQKQIFSAQISNHQKSLDIITKVILHFQQNRIFWKKYKSHKAKVLNISSNQLRIVCKELKKLQKLLQNQLQREDQQGMKDKINQDFNQFKKNFFRLNLKEQ